MYSCRPFPTSRARRQRRCRRRKRGKLCAGSGEIDRFKKSKGPGVRCLRPTPSSCFPPTPQLLSCRRADYQHPSGSTYSGGTRGSRDYFLANTTWKLDGSKTVRYCMRCQPVRYLRRTPPCHTPGRTSHRRHHEINTCSEPDFCPRLLLVL